MLCRASSYRRFEGTRIVRNVRNCSPNVTVCPRRLEFFAGLRILNRLYARALFLNCFWFLQLLHFASALLILLILWRGDKKATKQAWLWDMLPVQEEEADEGGRGRWARRLDGENLISKVVEESSWLCVAGNCREYGGMTVCFTRSRKVFFLA